MRKWAVVIVATGVCLACVTAMPHPSASQTTWASERWRDVTPAQLDAGRSLYLARCGGCHSLVAPGEVSRPEWPNELDKMAPRARLAGAEKDSVLRYLLTTAAP